MSHNRRLIIDTIGEENYHLTYNVLSTSCCVSIAYGYLRHARGVGTIIRPAAAGSASVNC